jgi:hypothetical protein
VPWDMVGFLSSCLLGRHEVCPDQMGIIGRNSAASALKLQPLFCSCLRRAENGFQGGQSNRLKWPGQAWD